MIKKIINYSRNREKSAIIWNVISCCVTSAQSVVMMALLTRTSGLNEAGIYSLAYSDAGFFASVGYFGMRDFQTSDQRPEYSFKTYFKSRCLTTALMLLFAVLITMIQAHNNHYSSYKCYVILSLTVFKCIDVIEDVFLGEFQRNNRLDIACKEMTLRLVPSIALMAVTSILLNDLVKAIVISIVFSVSFFIYLIHCCINNIFQGIGGYQAERNQADNKSIMRLMKDCLPITIINFCIYYIGIAPKLGIDAALSESDQAIYGMLSAPVFVIPLFIGFVYTPQMYILSQDWRNHKISDFKKRFCHIMLTLLIFVVITAIASYCFGTQILGIIFGTNLSFFKRELVILILGGGLYGATVALNSFIVILRQQKLLIVGYSIISLFSFFFSEHIVAAAGITGAALFYFLEMLLLALYLFFVFWIKLNQSRIHDMSAP